jgi:hypothetical protein
MFYIINLFHNIYRFWNNYSDGIVSSTVDLPELMVVSISLVNEAPYYSNTSTLCAGSSGLLYGKRRKISFLTNTNNKNFSPQALHSTEGLVT